MATDDLLTIDEVNAAIHVEISRLTERIEQLEGLIMEVVNKHNSLTFDTMRSFAAQNHNWETMARFIDEICEHVGLNSRSRKIDID